MDSLENFGAVIVCRDFEQMVQLANEIAPEHLEVMVQNPLETVGRFDNAGSVFLGVLSGAAGRLFCRPQPCAADQRYGSLFLSAVSGQFYKAFQFHLLPERRFALCCGRHRAIAQKEGLTAHANAITVRF